MALLYTLTVSRLAMVLGVERILDMTRTAVNVTGDASAAVWVAKTEGELNIPEQQVH